MIKTPLSTMIGGAGIWTPGCTVLGGQQNLTQIIKSLFANNEQGFAYDPNDLTTMFQDAAGTTPVSSTAQPVALMLDKSKGLKRSSNFNTNGTWTAGAEWTINGEIATVSGTGSYTNLDKTFATSPVTKIGDILKISINVLSITGVIQVRLSGGDIAYITKSGVNTLFLKSGGNYGLVRFQGGNGVTATVSLPSLVIEEVAGNHAYQTASAARPLFRQVPILGNELSNKTNVAGLAINAAAYDTYLLGGVLTAGKTYRLSVRISNYQGSGDVGFSASDFVSVGAKANGYYEFYKTALQTREVRLVTGMGATANFSEISVREVTGYLTDRNYIEYDGVDDKLITTLPAQLTGCTVVRAVPNVGTQILTNQTIPTTYNDNTDHCGLIVINRALTATETSQITKLFNKAAGV